MRPSAQLRVMGLRRLDPYTGLLSVEPVQRAVRGGERDSVQRRGQGVLPEDSRSGEVFASESQVRILWHATRPVRPSLSLSLSHSLAVALCLTACIYGRYGNGGYYTPGEAESLRAHNDRMDWLWQAVDFFAPELYLDLSSAHTHSPTHPLTHSLTHSPTHPENGTLKLFCVRAYLSAIAERFCAIHSWGHERDCAAV